MHRGTTPQRFDDPDAAEVMWVDHVIESSKSSHLSHLTGMAYALQSSGRSDANIKLFADMRGKSGKGPRRKFHELFLGALQGAQAQCLLLKHCIAIAPKESL